MTLICWSRLSARCVELSDLQASITLVLQKYLTTIFFSRDAYQLGVLPPTWSCESIHPEETVYIEMLCCFPLHSTEGGKTGQQFVEQLFFRLGMTYTFRFASKESHLDQVLYSAAAHSINNFISVDILWASTMIGNRC